MPLSNYGRNFYAELIVGRRPSPPPMYLALCTALPTAASTGSSLVEVGSRLLMPGGSGSWSAATGGVCSYTSDLVITTTWEDDWGTIVGYAICDSVASGTGNVLFYGSTPPLVVDGSFSLMYLDIQGIEVGVS
jgi:hypothetical protein